MPNANVISFMPTVNTADMSVAATASASSEYSSHGFQPVSIELPAAFDAATSHILFKVGNTSGDLDWLRYAGTIQTIAITLGGTNDIKRDVFDPVKFGGGWGYWQLHTCSDAAGTAQTQAADRTIKVNFAKVV